MAKETQKEIQITDGFFVINGKPFSDKSKNRLSTVTEEEFNKAKEVKYILPKGIIAIDADSEEAAAKIDKLLSKNNIKTFNYETSQGHKHFWFSVPPHHQRYIDDQKLNSSAHKIALDDKIDTRSCSTDGKTGAIYLKMNGKDKAGRPKPAELLEQIKDLPPVPLYLLHPKVLGEIPKGGDNWNNTALPMIGKMKFAQYPIEDIRQIFREAAFYHGDLHEDSQIDHKYDEATTLQWGGEKKYLPDWIYQDTAQKWISYKVKPYLKDTYLRFIKELKLSKQNGLVFIDGEFIADKLLPEIISTKLLKEGEKYQVEPSMNKVKDMTAKIIGLIESPIDNRELITFKNKTLDFKETRLKGELVWLPEKVNNHNPVQWNFMTREEIEASPNHMEMAKYMNKMFKLWEIDIKVLTGIGAYAMCKENFANRIFYFKGEGGRGKSTAIKMLLRLFDTTASGQYNPVKQNMGDEVAFVGTQIVYYMDLTDGAQNPLHLKPASTGDPIEIRPLYKQAIQHVPYSTMIFGTNFDVNWEGRSGGMSAADDRAFTFDFKGAKVRGTEIEDEYQKIKPLDNPYFMDVFASLCAHEIPFVLKNKFNDERSRKANSNSLNQNDLINVFVRETNWDAPEPIEIEGRRQEDARIYRLGKVSRDGKLYTTQKELWHYFNAWREEAKYKYQPNRDEFFKFLSNIVGKTLNSSNIKITDPEGLNKNRWIDLSIFKGDE